MANTIMLVDPSTMRQPFLEELLQSWGAVVRFTDAQKAAGGLERGLAVNAAVLRYRLALTPLIQTLRRLRPQARVMGYGPPRNDLPLGLDAYLSEPVLCVEVERVMDGWLGQGKKGRRASAGRRPERTPPENWPRAASRPR